MPTIPVTGGKLSITFVPDEGGEATPKPASVQPKKATPKIRGEIEKFFKIAFVIVVAFLIISHFYKKETTPSYLSASVSSKRVKEPARAKAEVKPVDGHPLEAWDGAYDKDSDGVVEAWEGIESKRIEYYSRGNNDQETNRNN